MDLSIYGDEPCQDHAITCESHCSGNKLTQSLLDDFVGEGASASLQFSISAFVNEFTNGFEVRVSPGDVRIGDSQHTQSRLVEFDESGVVDLS